MGARRALLRQSAGTTVIVAGRAVRKTRWRCMLRTGSARRFGRANCAGLRGVAEAPAIRRT